MPLLKSKHAEKLIGLRKTVSSFNKPLPYIGFIPENEINKLNA